LFTQLLPFWRLRLHASQPLFPGSGEHARRFSLASVVGALNFFSRSTRSSFVTCAVCSHGSTVSVPQLRSGSGRLMSQVIGAMAEFERSLIQERVRAGLRNAVAKGVQLGRPRATAGAGEVQAKLDAGSTMVQAAAALGVSESTVYRRLRHRSARKAS
jgi:hypothetical protein